MDSKGNICSRTRTRSGIVVAALIALGCTGALAVVGSPASGQPPVTTVPEIALTLDCSAFEALPAQAHGIQLTVAGDLLVTLCSNASTGFTWADPTISHPVILSSTRSNAEPAGSPVPGAAGTQTFGFHAEQPGTASVGFSYSQPWEGGQQDAWTVTLEVTVLAVTASPITFAVDCDAFGMSPFQEASTSLAVGDSLIVTLCTNASTGFTWADPQVSDTAVVALTDTRTEPAASLVPGAAGTQSWAFEAVAAGTAHIRLGYSQSWEGGDKDAWTFDLDVTVD